MRPPLVVLQPAREEDPYALKRMDNIAPWPPTLPLDLALGVDLIPVVLERYGLSQHDLDVISAMPAFRLELLKIGKEIRESGLSFKRKAAFQAETYLMDMDDLMHDETVPPSVKVDIFKTMTKLGELEPKDDKNSGNNGPQFNLQINIG